LVSPKGSGSPSVTPGRLRVFLRALVSSRVRGRLVWYLVLAVIAIPFFLPFWWMVTSSFKTATEVFADPSFFPSAWRWGNFIDAFRYQPFARHYFNSVYIAVIVTVATVLISSLSGYAYARLRFAGRSLLFVLILSSLMMPSEVTIIPNFFLMSFLGLTNTHWPLILLAVLGAHGALSTFIMRQHFLMIPGELEDAARIDGLGNFGIFLRIAMPIAGAAISAVTILTFLHSWNLFLEPLVFLNELRLFTLPLSLNNFRDAYGVPLWHLQLAATTMSVVPILVVYIMAQQKISSALAFSGLKG